MRRVFRRITLHGTSPMGRRLLATTFWSVMSESVSRGLLLVAMVFVARSLGKEAYGEFGIIRSTINMFASLGGMGLGLTANRFVSQFRGDDKTYSGQIIGSSYLLAAMSGAIVGITIFALSSQLASTYLRAPQLEIGLRIAGLLLFLGAISGAQIGILQGLEAYRRLAIGNLIPGLVALIALVGGSHYFGLDGALVGLLVYSCTGVVVLRWQITRELEQQGISTTYKGLGATLPLFWKFSLPVTLSGLAIAPLRWLAETMLVRRSGFGELGIFQASMTITTMLVVFVSTLNAPLISLTSNLGGSQTGRRIHYVNLYGSWYAFLALAVPLAVFPHLASLVFGAKYATPEFYTVNLLLLLYCALMMYYQGILRLIALKGSMWFGLSTNLIEGASLIGGFYILSGRGVVGLGAAYVFSYAMRAAVSLPYLARHELVPIRLLYDKYFAVTLAILAVIVALQIRRLT